MSSKKILYFNVDSSYVDPKVKIVKTGGEVSSSLMVLNPGVPATVEFSSVGNLVEGSHCYKYSNDSVLIKDTMRVESDPVFIGSNTWEVELVNLGSIDITLTTGDKLVQMENEPSSWITIFPNLFSTASISQEYFDLKGYEIRAFIEEDGEVDVVVSGEGDGPDYFF